jgi:hypothetical protein
VPEYTPFANIARSVKVSDRYGRWEHEIENPFIPYVTIDRRYKTETYYKFRQESGTHDFEVNHTRLYKTATYDIPAGTYELSFETIFGFAPESAFPDKHWVYHTRYQQRWDRCGNQYNYPWQTFVPDEYKLEQWSYYSESAASRIRKATKLVANGNNIEYPVVDYPNYVAEVDPRELEYECYTDIHDNPYAVFHFWNKDVWVGIPSNLHQEEKIYIMFFMYNEVWALGKKTLDGDPLEVHSYVITADKYHKVLNGEELPKQRIPW